MRPRLANRVLTIGALVAGMTVPVAATGTAATYDTTIVSRASGAGGAAATGDAGAPSISADGRFVAFSSTADNLSDQDSDAYSNVYVRDLQAGTTTLVSRAAEVAADGDSSDPSISADGRYVAFVSVATNLDAQAQDICPEYWHGEPVPCPNIFVRDLQAGTTTLVSRADGATGVGANGGSYTPAISPDGGRVLFQSVAENLSGQDVNDCVGYTETGEFPVPCLNIFIRDLRTGTTTYLAPGDHETRSVYCGPAVSPDGRYAAIETERVVRMVDLGTGAMTLVSRANGPDGVAAGGTCPSISGDGRRVAFEASSSLDENGCCGGWGWPEVYVRDLSAGTTTLVSRTYFHAPTLGKPSGHPSISADGRHVAFASSNPDLSPNGVGVYLRDLQTGELTYVSRRSGAGGAPMGGGDPSLSADGRVVAFAARAEGLDPAADQYNHVFARELATTTTPPRADLALSMTASTTVPDVGSDVTFTVTVTNAGPDSASGIVVAAGLPPSLTFVSATPSQGAYTAASGTWTVGSLGAGAGATLRIVANAGTATTSVTKAEVTAVDQTDPDSTPGNGNPAEDDQSSVTVTSTQQPSCAPVTAIAAADSWIGQNGPSVNHGTEATLKVRSKWYANARALVRFTLPTIPAGCQVSSAKLRLFATSATPGRTLRVQALTSPWNETTVTWRDQPGTTAYAATATSGPGWVEWTVTTQVNAMYSGANNGLRVRDAAEDSTGAEQNFASRDSGTSKPQLTVTFAPR